MSHEPWTPSVKRHTCRSRLMCNSVNINQYLRSLDSSHPLAFKKVVSQRFISSYDNYQEVQVLYNLAAIEITIWELIKVLNMPPTGLINVKQCLWIVSARKGLDWHFTVHDCSYQLSKKKKKKESYLFDTTILHSWKDVSYLSEEYSNFTFFVIAVT